MTDLNEAFKVMTLSTSSQTPRKIYIFQCTSCNSKNVNALINDGGSVQLCNDCSKTYKAKYYFTPFG